MLQVLRDQYHFELVLRPAAFEFEIFFMNFTFGRLILKVIRSCVHSLLSWIPSEGSSTGISNVL